MMAQTWHKRMDYPVGDDNIEIELRDGSIVVGWCTRRFLGGVPTYWTLNGQDSKPELVRPVRWRYRGDQASALRQTKGANA